MILLQAAASSFGIPEILLIVVAVLIYFLPGLIGRKKRNAASIALLNFLLGWTLIGWVIALIWAVSPDKEPIIVYNNNNKPETSKSDELLKFKKLLDDGVIT